MALLTLVLAGTPVPAHASDATRTLARFQEQVALLSLPSGRTYVHLGVTLLEDAEGLPVGLAIAYLAPDGEGHKLAAAAEDLFAFVRPGECPALHCRRLRPLEGGRQAGRHHAPRCDHLLQGTDRAVGTDPDANGHTPNAPESIQAPPDDAQSEREIIRSAGEWLALLGARSDRRAWAKSAPQLRGSTTFQRFTTFLNTTSPRRHGVRDRRWRSLLLRSPGGKTSEHSSAVVEFETRLADGRSIVEVVTVVRSRSKWTPAGYRVID